MLTVALNDGAARGGHALRGPGGRSNGIRSRARDERAIIEVSLSDAATGCGAGRRPAAHSDNRNASSRFLLVVLRLLNAFRAVAA